MKITHIALKVGIYDAEITVIDHGNKIEIKEPYVKWDKAGSSGSLSFKNWGTSHPKKMELIRQFVAEDCLALESGECWGDIDYID